MIKRHFWKYVSGLCVGMCCLIGCKRAEVDQASAPAPEAKLDTTDNTKPADSIQTDENAKSADSIQTDENAKPADNAINEDNTKPSDIDNNDNRAKPVDADAAPADEWADADWKNIRLNVRNYPSKTDQADKQEIDKEIVQLLQNWNRYYNARSGEKLASLYAEPSYIRGKTYEKKGDFQKKQQSSFKKHSDYTQTPAAGVKIEYLVSEKEAPVEYWSATFREKFFQNQKETETEIFLILRRAIRDDFGSNWSVLAESDVSVNRNLIKKQLFGVTDEDLSLDVAAIENKYREEACTEYLMRLFYTTPEFGMILLTELAEVDVGERDGYQCSLEFQYCERSGDLGSCDMYSSSPETLEYDSDNPEFMIAIDQVEETPDGPFMHSRYYDNYGVFTYNSDAGTYILSRYKWNSDPKKLDDRYSRDIKRLCKWE